jgi:glycosyltransferase involved in cell wall biosynthesis
MSDTTASQRPAAAAMNSRFAAGSPEAGAACDVTLVAHDVGAVGGMERQLAELALGLRRLGHDVTVIAHTCDLPPEAEVHFHRLRIPKRPFLISYIWFMIVGSLAVSRWRRGVVQTAGAIVVNRVDSIAVHCCHQVYSAAPARGSRAARLYGRLLSQVKRRAERWVFRRNGTARFVCVSNGVAEEMRHHYPEARERVLTIHNGVDLGEFAPARHGDEAATLRSSLSIAPERLVLAFVGGNWEDKGLRPVIEALAIASDWDLVVAGAGNPRPYEELARAKGVAERVHWLGVVPGIQAVYALADAFVLPSRYETFSLVTFEAAASGLPILATPVSGVSELIEDGANGFLVTPDAETIAGRLLELAADPELRARLGAAARAAALEYDWASMVAAHDELFAAMALTQRC